MTDAPRYRYDIAHISRCLAASELGGREWLEASWQDPQTFHSVLFTDAAASLRKSRPYESYDFHHDLCSQHLGKKLDAMLYRERDGSLRKLSYEMLDGMVGALCQRWRAQGVEPGACIAIVQPVGPFFAAALLATLRLGCIAACVPPRGKTYVHNRLQLLAPHFVAADAQHGWYVEGHTLLSSDLTALQNAPLDLGSHTYAASDPVLRCVSPLWHGEESVAELTADECYLPLLRDSVLILPIRQAEHVAIAGLDVETHQPCMLLATLLAGGCFVELTLADVVEDPTLLERAEVHVLGVSVAVRERIKAAGPGLKLPSLRRWFRSPLEALDWQAWRDFSARFHERGVGGCNLAVNAAHGGSFLFSPKGLTPDPLRMLPVPGIEWVLQEMNLASTPALFESGVFRSSVAGGLEATAGRFLMARADESYMLSGSVDALRNARIYPKAEVARFIETHPSVDHCVVVMVNDPFVVHSAKAVALLFVNPTRPELVREHGPRIVSELREQVQKELGPGLVPDQLEVYPLHPPLREGLVDEAWCTAQFSDGMLAKKSSKAVFSTLGALRRLFANTAERS